MCEYRIAKGFLVLVWLNFVIVSAWAQVDSDGDGAPDSWELAYSLDPSNGTDVLEDPDGDGLSSLFEYAFNTDPGQPNLSPVLRAGLTADAQFLLISFDRRTDDSRLEYELESTNDVGDSGSWRLGGFGLFSVEPLVGGQIERVTYRSDTPLVESGQRFVRIRLGWTNGDLPAEEVGGESGEADGASLVLLQSSLDDRSSVETPVVGVGGDSSLLDSDFTTAQMGNGARFDDDRYMKFPVFSGDQANINLDRGEIEFWFQPDFGAGESDDTIHSLITVGPFYDVPRLTISESDEFRLSILDRDWVAVTTSAGYRMPLWESGEWVLLRAAWDNSNGVDSLKLFVNDQRVDRGGAAGGWEIGPAHEIGELFVGVANEAGDFPANGIIDELVIRDKALTSTPPGGRNSPPRLDAIGDRVGAVGEVLSFVVSATDPDLDVLRFSLIDEGQTGAMIDPVSGAFVWTIRDDQEQGLYSITFRVSDDRIPAAIESETISISISNEVPSEGGGEPAFSGPVQQPTVIPLQAVGVPFVDPVFGYTVRRVSDASERGDFESHIYNQLQAFSVGNEYILLIDSQGYLVRRLDTLERIDALNTSDWNVPRWHPTLANTIVHFDTNADETVRVQRTNVETLVTTTVFEFPPQYRSIQGNPSFDELSRDGRWVAGVVTREDGASVIFSVDLVNQVLGAEVSIPDIYATVASPDPVWGALEPDWVGVSPLGNYLMVQWSRDDVSRASGLESWDIRSGEFVGRVTSHRHHGDLGLAADGQTEIFVTADFSPPFNPDGQATVYHVLPGPAEGASPHNWLVSVPWTDEDHISMQGPPGVGLVSWGSLDGALDEPLEDELFLLRMDGTVERLIHHRSSVVEYWVQPRASISRDGRYVIFASDWNRDTGGRGDPYIIDLQPER